MKTLLLIVAFFLIAGCFSGPNVQDMRIDYYSNKLPKAAAQLVSIIDEDSDDFAFRNLYYGTVAMEMGNKKAALEAFGRACEIADNIDLSNIGLTFVFSEKNKVMQGDPFERATAHFFRGWLLYERGVRDNNKSDIENAAASFKRCLEHDLATENEEFREDYALGFFMLSKTYLLLGDESNAKVAMAKARKVFPDNPYLDVNAIKNYNVTILIGLGIGPWKYQGGGFMGIGETDQIATSDPSIGVPEIYLDDKYLGKPSLILDLNMQAIHRPPQAYKVAASIGRQVLKEAISRLPGPASLLHHTISTEADLRAWDILPSHFYVLSAYVKPGIYTLRIKFAKEYEAYNQTHYFIPITDSVDNSYYFRIIYNRGTFPGYLDEKK